MKVLDIFKKLEGSKMTDLEERTIKIDSSMELDGLGHVTFNDPDGEVKKLLRDSGFMHRWVLARGVLRQDPTIDDEDDPWTVFIVLWSYGDRNDPAIRVAVETSLIDTFYMLLRHLDKPGIYPELKDVSAKDALVAIADMFLNSLWCGWDPTLLMEDFLQYIEAGRIPHCKTGVQRVLASMLNLLYNKFKMPKLDTKRR